jgi:hypothetical protein
MLERKRPRKRREREPAIGIGRRLEVVGEQPKLCVPRMLEREPIEQMREPDQAASSSS